jgi:hypothetical protein
MNLEQAVHQRLAADVDLAALLPSERIVTGRHSGGELPCATIHRKRNRKVLRTNAGDVDEAILLVHVWHDDYDAGRAIADKVATALDACGFPLSGSQRVVRIRRSADSAEEHDDGLWQFSLEFLVQIYLPSGT